MEKRKLKLLVLICLFLNSNYINAQQVKDPVNYSDKSWVKTGDENIVYYQIHLGSEQNKKTDSISLKVLGTLDSSQHLITSPFDALVFESFYGIEQKKYAKKDFLELSFGEVVKDMPDNGIVYIRCKKDLQFLKRTTFSLRIYFKEPEDTILQRKFVNEILQKSFADSVRYYTKKEAEALYLSETGDVSWKKLLDTNPFPAFAEVYISYEFINEKEISEIAKKLEANKLVSSVEYPKVKTFISIHEWDRLYQIPFILKVEFN